MTRPSYNCSQSDLIIVLGTILDSFVQYLAFFMAFSGVYTALWGTARQTQLADAAAMTDEETVRAASEGMRVILVKACKQCRILWQALKRHINRCFAPDMVPFKLKAAGSNFYKNASNENWPQAQQMFTNALNFIDANLATLTAVMPATFKTDFTAKVDVFKQALKDYEQSKETISELTQERVKALNAIHREVAALCEDAQLIFEDDEAVRKQFVFSDVLSRVSGAGLAGLRGTVTNSMTNGLIANVSVIVKDGNDVVIGFTTTDAEGNFLLNTPSGMYNVFFDAAGYVQRMIEKFTVDVGTVSRLDITLSAEVPEDGE